MTQKYAQLEKKVDVMADLMTQLIKLQTSKVNAQTASISKAKPKAKAMESKFGKVPGNVLKAYELKNADRESRGQPAYTQIKRASEHMYALKRANGKWTPYMFTQNEKLWFSPLCKTMTFNGRKLHKKK